MTELACVNIKWNFSSCFFNWWLIQGTFFTRWFYFTITEWLIWERGKKCILQGFFRDFGISGIALLKFYGKFGKFINTVDFCWLKYSKIELHTNHCWRQSTSQALWPVSSEQHLQKLIFNSLKSHCLEQFLCFILIIALSCFRYWFTGSLL